MGRSPGPNGSRRVAGERLAQIGKRERERERCVSLLTHLVTGPSGRATILGMSIPIELTLNGSLVICDPALSQTLSLRALEVDRDGYDPNQTLYVCAGPVN
jgi:hypothetical protein